VLGQLPVTKRLSNSNSIPAAMTTWRPTAITSLGSSLWVSLWGQGNNQGSVFFYMVPTEFTSLQALILLSTEAVGITQTFKRNSLAGKIKIGPYFRALV